ncbi:GTP cyclohydrolase II [bacterium]|nr:GTP cyclohydrolase II [bacterium]
MSLSFDKFEDCLADLRAGRQIVLVDDEDRENEGDLVCAAELVTEENLAFMMGQGKGLICLSLDHELIDRLKLSKQVTENTAPLGTNFKISIDHRSVKDFGVTARGRAATIRAAVSPTATAADFISPGFVFPLGAQPGGVLKRIGQTEGSVDMARLAGLQPGAVICEIMSPTGEMLRGQALGEFCKAHNLKLTSVAEIRKHRLAHEISVRQVAQTKIELADILPASSSAERQAVTVYVYIDDHTNDEHLVFVIGNPQADRSGAGVLARLHSECLTGDVFESQRCDCGSQFDRTLAAMINAGSGVLVYLQQEGRGIGLANKLRAYQLQDRGLDTVQANLELGFAADERDYRVGAQILLDLGIDRVALISNNPDKQRALESYGVKVISRVNVPSAINQTNRSYLEAKRDRLGHLIDL